jgi:hypothetical protein
VRTTAGRWRVESSASLGGARMEVSWPGHRLG